MKKIFLFLIGLSISVTAAWFLSNDLIFFRTAEVGHGIAVKSVEHRSFLGRESWEIVARFFPPGGGEIISHPYRSTFPPDENQNVKFFYNSTHPEDAREIGYIQRVRNKQFLGLFVGALLMLMAFVGDVGKKPEKGLSSPFKRGLKNYIVILVTFLAIMVVVYAALLGFLLLLSPIRSEGTLNWITFFIGVFLMLMAFVGDIWKMPENGPGTPFKRGLRIFNIILGSILAGYVARKSFYLAMARTDSLEELRWITFTDLWVGPLYSLILYLLFHRHVARIMKCFMVVTYLLIAMIISLFYLTMHFNQDFARGLDPFIVFLR